MNRVRSSPVISYPVREDLAQYLPSLAATYVAKNVSVCDAKDAAIPTGHRNRVLKNALVRVNFCLSFDPVEGLVAELSHVTAVCTDFTKLNL